MKKGIQYSIVALLVLFTLFTFYRKKEHQEMIHFPESLKRLEECPKGKVGRIIAFYKNSGYSQFEKEELRKWDHYYRMYGSKIDFCFIIEHIDTLYFKQVVNEINFTPPYVFDKDKEFGKAYNYLFISFLTTPKNQLVEITNPSLGMEFEKAIESLIPKK